MANGQEGCAAEQDAPRHERHREESRAELFLGCRGGSSLGFRELVDTLERENRDLEVRAAQLAERDARTARENEVLREMLSEALSRAS